MGIRDRGGPRSPEAPGGSAGRPEQTTPPPVVSALIVGLVIGVLARAILPGKQRIPIWLTVLQGIVAALIGTYLARALGLPTVTRGVDWWELLVQLVVALVVVAALAGVAGRRVRRR